MKWTLGLIVVLVALFVVAPVVLPFLAIGYGIWVAATRPSPPKRKARAVLVIR